MVALSALVSGLDVEMLRLGYKDSTMAWYRGSWRRLQRYFAAREAEEFSLDLAMAWVDEACGFFAKEWLCQPDMAPLEYFDLAPPGRGRGGGVAL